MGRYRVPPDAWRQATLALLRYPEIMHELDEIVRESMTHDPEKTGGSKPAHADPTATSAVKLISSKRYQRLKQEAEAVKMAIDSFDEIEIGVINQRFFSHRKGVRTPKPYSHIRHTGYSRRQMQRICKEVITKVAVNLGEL